MSANNFKLKGSVNVYCCSFSIPGHVLIGEIKFKELLFPIPRKGSDDLVPLLRVSSAKSWVQPIMNDSLIADMQLECSMQFGRSIAQSGR